ncbi:hypothetical protein CYMTET_37807 [Cymbomonas tetramitiformis]|uniref:GPI transamidase component PIG-S n=1 Tax=Cymbomonas tetramitiformis TaxID=36881 RepID=A0AAE0F786_9CHLO|nr:hypothetical protein CYMTET_37807 [Cymbomonas tetramitiformis]
MIKALQPLAHVSTDSQVLYYTRARSTPKWNIEMNAYSISRHDLPFFVDSDWNLNSPTTPADVHTLHFVVYVPPKEHCPLIITSSDGKALRLTAGAASPHQMIPPDELNILMAVVAAQLRGLIGLRPVPPASACHTPTPGGFTVALRGLPVTASALAEWEVDVLIRRRVMESQTRALHSLGSFADIVRKLPSIVVLDQIASQAAEALSLLQAAREGIAAGWYDVAIHDTQKAQAVADDVFFHPTVLAQLYFPGEQKLAVYLPITFPILTTVVARAAWELWHWYWRRTGALAQRLKTE